MNIWDILILLLVSGLVVLAIRQIRKARSCGCTGCCASCQAGCHVRSGETV
ncbi:MAG: hypothetical protein IJ246_03205 [Clostridia bacterium]|nr:hypothetical protein [Clostridia bacterium]